MLGQRDFMLSEAKHLAAWTLGAKVARSFAALRINVEGDRIRHSNCLKLK